MKILLPTFIICLLIGMSGCTELKTTVSIPEKKIPASFPGQINNSSSIAPIKWRQYFTDKQLQTLIDTAINNNPDLQIALQRIEVSRSSVKLANAALLPEVKLNIGSSLRKFGLYTMDGAGNATTHITPGQTVPSNLPDIYLGIQSSWEIDIWGKLRSMRQSAISQYLASIEGTNFVISSLVADVAIYYNELLTLDNQLEIIKQTLSTQEEALEVIKWQKEAGRTNELAVQQFTAQLLSTQALEQKVLQQITETENKLNFLLGRYPQPISRNKDTFYDDIPATISVGLPSQMLINRPDIRAAEYEIMASQFDLKAAKAAFYPNFNITANLGFQAFDPEFLFMTPSSLAYSVMGTLVAPIINLNALKARFNTAKANQITAMYNYQKTVLNAYVEVANELNNIQYLKKITKLKKAQSDTLRRAISTSKELYTYTRATYLEVLTAQQSALQSNLELIDATKKQRTALVNIYKALGGGWR